METKHFVDKQQKVVVASASRGHQADSMVDRVADARAASRSAEQNDRLRHLDHRRRSDRSG